MITTWSAVSTLDRMLDDVMGSAYGTATTTRTFEPAIDVRASESEVVFSCDVPGLTEADLEITLAERVLTIQGNRKFEGNPKEQVVLGRSYGSFRRAFTLPDTVDDEKLTAHLEGGVLTLRIPKIPKATPRKISIGSGNAKQLDE